MNTLKISINGIAEYIVILKKIRNALLSGKCEEGSFK